jgi:hypothetical protein
MQKAIARIQQRIQQERLLAATGRDDSDAEGDEANDDDDEDNADEDADEDGDGDGGDGDEEGKEEGKEDAVDDGDEGEVGKAKKNAYDVMDDFIDDSEVSTGVAHVAGHT